MYSEIEHSFFSTMSNSELFLVREDQEDIGNSKIVERPMMMKFQSECHERVSNSSGSHSRAQKEEKKEQEVEEEEHCDSRIPVEDEEDGFRTPTSLDHRIPVAKQCPAPPRKPKPSLKRKASQSLCSCRHPLDLSKEVELLFPIQHNPLSDSQKNSKKSRREELKVNVINGESATSANSG